MTLADGEELEGLAANDRSLIEGAGLLLTPPDTRSNTQRIYVPRQAIQSLEVVSLIGVSARRRAEAASRGKRTAGALSRVSRTQSRTSTCPNWNMLPANEQCEMNSAYRPLRSLRSTRSFTIFLISATGTALSSGN